jgi:lipoate-protein ligase B
MEGEESKNNNSGQRGFFTDLGTVGVPEIERLMIEASEDRLAGHIPDLLLFLAHPPTVSVGIKDRNQEHPRDLLVSRRRLKEEGITLARSIRGGGITYHWPGQLVCYPLVSLGPGERNLPLYMERLEQVGVETLAGFGVDAERRRHSAAHVGLWHKDRKVVSMGVRVSRWITSFGFAINLEGDLAPSRYVRPCGIEGIRLTTLEEILQDAPSRVSLEQATRESFMSVFGRQLERMPEGLLQRMKPTVQPIDIPIAAQGCIT